MANLEPETEANSSSHEDAPDGSQNTSSISFNEPEDGKVPAHDPEMFPNFDPAKAGGQDKKDLGKKFD